MQAEQIMYKYQDEVLIVTSKTWTKTSALVQLCSITLHMWSHLINSLEKQEFTMFPIKKEQQQATKHAPLVPTLVPQG